MHPQGEAYYTAARWSLLLIRHLHLLAQSKHYEHAALDPKGKLIMLLVMVSYQLYSVETTCTKLIRKS